MSAERPYHPAEAVVALLVAVVAVVCVVQNAEREAVEARESSPIECPTGTPRSEPLLRGDPATSPALIAPVPSPQPARRIA